jgi:hypothetical protein
MSLYVFTLVFVLLTLLHPIGDFGTPKRRFKLEFWIVMNPLHWLWDLSSFRKHGKYDCHDPLFWKWLAVDQFAHVLQNIILAAFVGILF